MSVLARLGDGAAVVTSRIASGTIRRVIYVIEYPLRENDLDRYGIQQLKAWGIEVRIIDIGDVTQPNVPQDRVHYRAFGDLDILVLRTSRELGELPSRLGAADLVLALIGTAGLTRHNLAAFRAISRSPAPYLMLFVNAFPGWNKYVGERGVFRERLRHIAQRLGEIDWINSAIARLPPRLLGVRTADFVVYGGLKSRLPHRLNGSTTRVIGAHSMDYERYRRLDSGTISQRPSAVFIDEYLPYHPDIKVLNTTSPMSPEAYFLNLRGLFDRIESELDLDVIVAANPRADYSDKPNLFGRRQVVQFATARLIRESALVIAHRSTAIGLAVVARKPVILAATEPIYRHSAHRPVFDALSRALNRRIVFFDRPPSIDLSGALDVDHAAYDRFIEDYMRHPDAPDLPLWQIIVEGAARMGAQR